MATQDVLKNLNIMLDQIRVSERMYPECVRTVVGHSSERRQIDELEKQLEPVIDSLRGDDRLPAILFRLGNIHFQEGNIRRAINLYEYALRVDPSQCNVWLNLARAYSAVGRREDASRCLKNLITIDSKNVEALAMLAMMALEEMRIDECRKYLVRLSEIDPDHAAVHYCRANLYLKTGSIEAAIMHYKKAIQSDALYLPAYLAIGQVYISRREYDNAIEMLQLGLRHDPENPLLLSTLGDAFAEKGERERALEHYAKALAMRPDDVRLWIRKGDIHRLQRSYKEAASSYEHAISADPDNLEAWLKTAQMLLLLNEREAALECMNTARSLAPNNSQVAQERGVVLLALGRLEEALKDFDDAFSLSPDNPIHLYYRAQTLERLGRYAEARRTWEVAHELFNETGNRVKAAECLAHLQRSVFTV